MSQPYKLDELTALVDASARAGNEGKRHNCLHRAECMKMIELVIDGEASSEQFEHIRQNIGKCLPCEQGYSLEKSVKEALQFRLEKREVPTNLLEIIRSRVSSL